MIKYAIQNHLQISSCQWWSFCSDELTLMWRVHKIYASMYLTNRWCDHLFLITPAALLDIYPWTLRELSKSQSVVIKWCCGIPITIFRITFSLFWQNLVNFLGPSTCNMRKLAFIWHFVYVWLKSMFRGQENMRFWQNILCTLNLNHKLNLNQNPDTLLCIIQSVSL